MPGRSPATRRRTPRPGPAAPSCGRTSRTVCPRRRNRPSCRSWHAVRRSVRTDASHSDRRARTESRWNTVCKASFVPEMTAVSKPNNNPPSAATMAPPMTARRPTPPPVSAESGTTDAGDEEPGPLSNVILLFPGPSPPSSARGTGDLPRVRRPSAPSVFSRS